MSTSKIRRPSLPYPEEAVFHFLKKTAEQLPNKTAVIDVLGGRRLTFLEMDRESDALARALLDWGLQKGDRVSFFMPNGWEYFVGFYAAMEMGAVVSPMNPTLRQREVKNQVNDAESRVILIQQDHFPVVEKILPEMPSLEKVILSGGKKPSTGEVFSPQDLLKKYSAPLPRSLPSIQAKADLAALPYSSGTAGLSKGVMITHYNLVCNPMQSMNAVGARGSDIFIRAGARTRRAGAVRPADGFRGMARVRAERRVPRVPQARAGPRRRRDRDVRSLPRGQLLSTDIRIPVTLVGTNSARAVATNAMRGQVWDNFSSETYKSLPAVGAVHFYNPYSGKPADEWGNNDVYYPPAGGPGYYRPASLVSIWATAPFLHNNALARYTGDPSVQGRLDAFDDAVDKLLSKAKRVPGGSPRPGDLRSAHEKLESIQVYT